MSEFALSAANGGLQFPVSISQKARRAAAKGLLTLLFGLWAACLFAAANNWSGGTSTDWFTATNWSLGTVPVAADEVTIPSGTPFQPTIGAAGAVAQKVTVNAGATLTLTAAGVLSINGSSTEGLNNNGTVTNNGTINSGIATANAFAGVSNSGTFNNNAGAKLNIDRVTNGHGLLNAATFTNKGMIVIGATVGIPAGNGIANFTTFTNDFTGTIAIDRSSVSGIINQGTFTNKNLITIGGTASPGTVGIVNNSNFDNTFFGTITIDRSTLRGIGNSGTFQSRGILTIGAVASVGTEAINNLAGTFENGGVCGLLTIYAPIANSATFIQDGRLVSITLSAHTNGGTFTNGGVIMYPLGNPIPGVVNNEIIALPVIGACSDITNVLSLGAAPMLSPTTTWYLDPALTLVAGTYNQATNTLTPTGFPPNVPTTVYFQVDQPDCGLLTISLPVQYGQSPAAPSATCLMAFCVGDNPTVANLIPNGPGYSWYTTPTGGAPLAANTPLVNGGDYYVSQLVMGCQSFRAHVRVIVTTPAPGHICIGGCSN